ncbi:MAG: hypothetical protein R3B53_02430 [Candidatus Paceibacterota bacterium]
MFEQTELFPRETDLEKLEPKELLNRFYKHTQGKSGIGVPKDEIIAILRLTTLKKLKTQEKQSQTR